MRTFFKQHQLAAFLGLAFALTWLSVLPLVLQGLGFANWNIHPLWHTMGAFGPLTAACIVSAISDGRAGVLDLWRRMTNWKVGGVWLAIVILSPVLLFTFAYLAVWLSGVSVPNLVEVILSNSNQGVWVANIILPSLAYGFGEEPGWRGIVLPQLQRRYHPVLATFVLTIFWGIWHLPFFAYRFTFGIGELIGFFISLFAGAVLFTRIYNGTGGSILCVSIWHVIWNILNILALSISMLVVGIMSTLVIGIACMILSWDWYDRVRHNKQHSD
jgi:uncharacterized protein